MAAEDSKMQNTLWWIASIAVSVLCCSALFVLFASYLVEVKNDIRDSNQRMNLIEAREDAILANLEAMRKHGVTIPPAGAPEAAAPASAAPADTAAPATPDAAPAATTAPEQPAVSVPGMPAPADKK